MGAANFFSGACSAFQCYDATRPPGRIEAGYGIRTKFVI
jgi:hypothetical protein